MSFSHAGLLLIFCCLLSIRKGICSVIKFCSNNPQRLCYQRLWGTWPYQALTLILKYKLTDRTAANNYCLFALKKKLNSGITEFDRLVSGLFSCLSALGCMSLTTRCAGCGKAWLLSYLCHCCHFSLDTNWR